jgi:peroxiredoxin
VKTLAQLGFIALAASTVYGFVHAAQKDQRRSTCTALCALSPAYAARDRLAPDFELSDTTGKSVKLSSLRGKTVVLNFWTKTCRPCLEEMPALAELATVAATERDLVVLTISTDETAQEAIDTLRVVLGGPAPFQTLMDPDAKVVAEKFGTKLYPETWVIDPTGIIRARFDGARDWSNPLALDFLRMVGRPSGCPIEFASGTPTGDFAGICGEE